LHVPFDLDEWGTHQSLGDTHNDHAKCTVGIAEVMQAAYDKKEPEDGTEYAGGHDDCHVDESRNRSWSRKQINPSATSSEMSDTARTTYNARRFGMDVVAL
jgi:hypothetical protein